MSEVLPAVGNIIAQCSAWFLQVLNAVDGFAVWLTAILVWLSFKFLLMPVFGVASSDMAKKKYNAYKPKNKTDTTHRRKEM